MADYTQITNFTVKDDLAAGDPNKLIKGVDFDGEFAAISTSLSTTIDANDASGTGAAELPKGTTAQRPTPTIGMFRFNSENNAFEGYDGSNWVPLVGASDDSGTGAANLPKGTVAERPVVPLTGMFRYNEDYGTFEGYDGSAWGGVGGASGGAGNPFIYENNASVTADYTMTSGNNGMSAGPITIESGATITIPTGSVWSIV